MASHLHSCSENPLDRGSSGPWSIGRKESQPEVTLHHSFRQPFLRLPCFFKDSIFDVSKFCLHLFHYNFLHFYFESVFSIL